MWELLLLPEYAYIYSHCISSCNSCYLPFNAYAYRSVCNGCTWGDWIKQTALPGHYAGFIKTWSSLYGPANWEWKGKRPVTALLLFSFHLFLLNIFGLIWHFPLFCFLIQWLPLCADFCLAICVLNIPFKGFLAMHNPFPFLDCKAALQRSKGLRSLPFCLFLSVALLAF